MCPNCRHVPGRKKNDTHITAVFLQTVNTKCLSKQQSSVSEPTLMSTNTCVLTGSQRVRLKGCRLPRFVLRLGRLVLGFFCQSAVQGGP